ncbi:uncharacterized protein LOC132047261 [Lycium ferocissimum]|uniref:uncharacterized protein LOC132047261 n=1 Tax=Lycium ferocissimum TaxID=112874 RepID=UPI002814F474|nr:uncharacterized protein LOC132047261 [Lycium ferocissimum]
MGKKGEEEGGSTGKEGFKLLGNPSFKKLENGRYKCVQTGHELPEHARESYAQSKHCRLGLIDAALSKNKPPLNMFNQDPLNRSKLICKLTGDTVNKSEEHIWKHMSGKRFLRMLEKKETENEMENGGLEKQGENEAAERTDSKASRRDKKKNKKKEIEDAGKAISEIRDSSEKNSDSGEDAEFWMPPVGARWDYDDGGDRWGSGSESGEEDDDANEEDEGTKEDNHDAGELSKRAKRMSLEIGPSSFASRKKKKKTSAT